MRKVVVTNNLTLDGVMQAPGRADEDIRGGFDRGGWALRYNDPVMGRVMREGMAQTGALLLGPAPTRTSRPSGLARRTTLSPRCWTTSRSTSRRRP
jgi:hypothetical protein